jgi:hypothetical protein
MSSGVITADLKKSPTIHAETGTVPNARLWSKSAGSMTGEQNCCPAAIFTSSLPCRMTLTPSSAAIKKPLSTCYSAVSRTLLSFGKNPQWHLEGQIGFILILHTCSQTLIDHYHLHCLIPGGAFSPDKSHWTHAKTSFLFRVQSLAKAFKHRYLKLLTNAKNKNNLIFPGKTKAFESQNRFNRLLESLLKTKWIVYAKRPFAGPKQVLEYLGRYTHRVAISNNRIKPLTTDRSLSPIKIAKMITKSRKLRYRPKNLSGAFFCMFFRKDL